MIKSMTGFGKGTAVAGAATVSVEIKTVNHRFCDISVKAPRSLLVLESELRKKVGERLRRGKIDLFITLEFASGGSAIPTLNQPLAEAYYSLFEELRTRFALSGEVPLALLAGQRDVLQLQEGQVPEAQLHGAVAEALTAALERVEAMRRVEGEATRRDMEERLALLGSLLEQIAARAGQVPGEWQAKLRERLARLAPDVAFDPQRVAQEVALFADRCDISEELTRFLSHLEQFSTLLGSPEAVGRQLDFLVQELNRETNTIGSKSNDAELTRQVVTIKSELEKIREQVQNVE
jgi:uncharacterized protein (TIGR00255 family)